MPQWEHERACPLPTRHPHPPIPLGHPLSSSGEEGRKPVWPMQGQAWDKPMGVKRWGAESLERLVCGREASLISQTGERSQDRNAEGREDLLHGS